MKSVCKLVSLMIAGCILNLVIPMNLARADYLVRPMPAIYPAPFPTGQACMPCDCGLPHCYRHHVKKHRTIKKHYRPVKRHVYRHYRRAHCYVAGCSVCSRCPAPQHDFVTFEGGPAPYVRGARWVEPCDDYVSPDRATGDDDPMIYPGMNIDN